MSDLLGLSPSVTVLAIAACFMAGAVRGFSGFGLSALAMAVLATVIPPIQLIPAFWFLEMAASLVLMKGGWADGDRKTAALLMVSAGIGLPISLSLSLSMDPFTSKLTALLLLIVLALLQLRRMTLPFLATTPGTLASGLCAGMVTGLSGAGGMFIALYALARDLPARRMRGTLNIYLLGGGMIGLAVHLVVGTMTSEAATRGLVLVAPTLIGVFVGKALFVPKWEPYYKPFCLTLLILLAVLGIVRLVLGA